MGITAIADRKATPEALDRLSQFAAPALVEQMEEAEEILEVAEVTGDVPDAEPLELVEEVQDLVPAEEIKPQRTGAPEFEVGDAVQWYLPPADELRDILSQLDDPGPQSKKRR